MHTHTHTRMCVYIIIGGLSAGPVIQSDLSPSVFHCFLSCSLLFNVSYVMQL